jgi:arylformamidase
MAEKMPPLEPVDDGQPALPVDVVQRYVERVDALARRPLPASVRVWAGLSYGPLAQQRFDVFAPMRARAAPVLVFFHGGGWTNGYRHWVRLMAAPVVEHGVVLVAPSYRLVHHARFPAACDDCALLVRQVKAHAATWGGDSGRLYLSGHSAGGHLAALTTLRAPGVRGCLPLSGIMDLHHPAPAAGSLEERVYTQVLSDRDDDAASSPIHWTRGNTVPFVLCCGERDTERVLRSNRRMAALLELQPAQSRFDIWPGCDHFDTHLALADAQHPWYARLSEMIEETS